MILSELIALVKTKLKESSDGTFAKKIKRRLLLNLKKSGITSISVKTERPELPRILDVIFANLDLMRAQRAVEDGCVNLYLTSPMLSSISPRAPTKYATLPLVLDSTHTYG